MYLAGDRGQLGQGLRLGGLPPDADQFGLDIATLSSGDGSKHIALFMHQAALARRRCKQFPDRDKQSIVAIGDDEVNLCGPSCAQIVQETEPSLFALLGTHMQCQHLFVALQIHPEGRQNDRGVGFFPMANAKMHSIEVEHSPMRLQNTLPPRLKLLCQCLVEPTDRAGTGRNSQQRFGDFSHGCRVLTPATNICVSPSVMCGS